MSALRLTDGVADLLVGALVVEEERCRKRRQSRDMRGSAHAHARQCLLYRERECAEAISALNSGRPVVRASEAVSAVSA